MEKSLDLSVVPSIELEKYPGTWYEIARFDHRFERGLVGVTANYTMREDGLIKVTNSGFQDSLQVLTSNQLEKPKFRMQNKILS
jgi:lipocalin